MALNAPVEALQTDVQLVAHPVGFSLLLLSSSSFPETGLCVICRIKKCRLPNNMRRCQALSADGLRLIIWRDIIFFLCVSKSLVFLALFFGPMPLLCGGSAMVPDRE